MSHHSRDASVRLAIPRLFPGCFLAASFVLAGCSSNRSDLVEAELRTREREIRELHVRLDQTKAFNYALERELHDARAACPPEPGAASASVPLVKDIQLGRQTGGYDEDGQPGDEALQVVLVPRDADESPVKAAGSLRVTALDITAEGLKVPVSTWEVPALDLRRTWKSGLFSTGYFVILPWKATPTSERLRVVAQFVATDGRVYEAERDVTVHLPPGQHRPPPQGPPAAPFAPFAPPSGPMPPAAPAGTPERIGPPQGLPGRPQTFAPLEPTDGFAADRGPALQEPAARLLPPPG
jgi:hypothetical protein